jgi:hypothetical protein
MFPQRGSMMVLGASKSFVLDNQSDLSFDPIGSRNLTRKAEPNNRPEICEEHGSLRARMRTEGG